MTPYLSSDYTGPLTYLLKLSWSTKENRNWEDYKVRLADQAPFLDRMDVKYYPSSLIDWKKSDFTYETIKKD